MHRLIYGKRGWCRWVTISVGAWSITFKTGPFRSAGDCLHHYIEGEDRGA